MVDFLTVHLELSELKLIGFLDWKIARGKRGRGFRQWTVLGSKKKEKTQVISKASAPENNEEIQFFARFPLDKIQHLMSHYSAVSRPKKQVSGGRFI